MEANDGRVTRTFRVRPSILKTLDDITKDAPRGTVSQIIEDGLEWRLRLKVTKAPLSKDKAECLETLERLLREGEPKTIKLLLGAVAEQAEIDEFRKAQKNR